jgi:nicotinate-nucleotide adenylyltransferase
VKIAMLGGSFNPPHIGHRALAGEVMRSLGYTAVLFVPARERPLKTAAWGASDKDRLVMTAIAVSEDPAFMLETCEMERKGPSYTYDTIVYLTGKYKDTLEGKIGLIIGDDLAESFCHWYRYEELPVIADIILARRIRAESAGSVPDFPFRHIRLEKDLPDVSSTDIRNRILHGDSWRHLAGNGISEYIESEKLYGYRDF